MAPARFSGTAVQGNGPAIENWQRASPEHETNSLLALLRCTDKASQDLFEVGWHSPRGVNGLGVSLRVPVPQTLRHLEEI